MVFKIELILHSDFRAILTSPVQSDVQVEFLELEDELFGIDKSSEKEDGLNDYLLDDAYQGEEAIQMVIDAANENHPYSLIFMDVRMPPGIDGIPAKPMPKPKMTMPSA